jgi:tetratricopeptide (TPR) repeat protein
MRATSELWNIEQAIDAHARMGAQATVLHNLARLAWADHHFALAESLARRAIAERSGEDDLFDLGTDLCVLADALMGQGRLEDAERIYREALDRFDDAGVEEHGEVACALHRLAECLSAQGRASEAQVCHLQAIDLRGARS